MPMLCVAPSREVDPGSLCGCPGGVVCELCLLADRIVLQVVMMPLSFHLWNVALLFTSEKQ